MEQSSTHTPVAASVALAAHAVEQQQEPLYGLRRLLQSEGRATRKRNAAYLSAVQRDGMTAAWRQKMSHWMFETGSAFGMTIDTVGCAIHYMDVYLSSYSVNKSELQLLCLVTMYVASKMHESQPISMSEMRILSQHKFARHEINQLEADLLKLLDWQLNPPTSFTIARDLIHAMGLADQDQLVNDVLDFLQDATEDLTSTEHESSSIAVAAVHLLCHVQQRDEASALSKLVASLDLSVDALARSLRWVLNLYRSKNPEVSSELELDWQEPGAHSPISVEADTMLDGYCYRLGLGAKRKASSAEETPLLRRRRRLSSSSDN